MGLFGLFATLFGLGAMAKDGIEDYFISESSKEKALREGSLEYYSNGKFQKVYTPKGTLTKEVKDPVSGHIYDTNARTGERLYDLTEYHNNKVIKENKAKNLADGCVFYRTPIFDTPSGMNYRAHTGREMSSVYVCDSIPGYFERVHNFKISHLDRKGFTIYVRGELAPRFCDEKRKEVNTPIVNKDTMESVEAYFEDGVRMTRKEFARRFNEWSKNNMLENDKKYGRSTGKFYNAKSDTLDDIYKSMDDDKIYTIGFANNNVRNPYYIEATIESYQRPIAPHHEEMVTCYKVVPVKGTKRYNQDGTKYVD